MLQRLHGGGAMLFEGHLRRRYGRLVLLTATAILTGAA